MNAVLKGFGDFQTWGGRSFDSDPAYEAWRENTPIIEAIGEEEAGEILELLWSGKNDDAATRLAQAYGKAWDAQEKQIADSAALAKAYRLGRVPAGYDD